jgi:hypothetical protein
VKAASDAALDDLGSYTVKIIAKRKQGSGSRANYAFPAGPAPLRRCSKQLDGETNRELAGILRGCLLLQNILDFFLQRED